MNWRLIIALVPAIALGADLKSPFSLPSAKLLPKGVRNFSYKGVYAAASDKYDNSGMSVPVAAPLNQTVTFQKAIDGKREAWEKAALEQAMIDLGKNPNDAFGSTTGDVKVAATAHVPVFAYGLNSKLTVALAVPVLESSMHVDHGMVQANPETHQALVGVLTSKGVPSSVAEFDEKMADPTGTKLRDYGYKDPQNENKTKLGDIKAVAKYGLFERSGHMLATNLEVTLPTGQDQDVDKAIDVASGDDQTDLGLGMIYEYALTDSVSLSTSGSYTWQFADNTSKRVPEVSYSKATPDIDQNVRRNLGDVASMQVGAAWSAKGFNLGAGYAFQYKGEDKYSGNAYEAQRYEWMGIDSVQNMHSVQLVGGFDTIYLFKKKAFAAPLKILFTHSRVIEGKNVVKDSMNAIDFNMFF